MGCRVLQSVAVYCNKQSRMCCSVESIAVSCSELQCVVACCSVLQCVAVCCSHLQCIAVCQLRCVALCCNTNVVSFDISSTCALAGLQCVALCCSALQCVAERYSVLQHTCCIFRHDECYYTSCKRVTANIYISHVKHKDESRHTQEGVTAHIFAWAMSPLLPCHHHIQMKLES